MKKRVNCYVYASIDIEIDIPEYLIEDFESDDIFRDWGRGDKNSEIYEILTDEICKNIESLDWNEIEIINEEDIEDEIGNK